MARQRRTAQSMAPSRPRVVKQRTAGEPQPTLPRATFPKTVLRRLQTRRSIRTLIKEDPAIGMSTKDAATVTRSGGQSIPNGVKTPGGGGYYGVTAVFKPRADSTRPAKGTKRVATPRKAPGGVRNPFRIGRGS
jgi:hypothetical protein